MVRMIRAPWVRLLPLRPGHCCHRAQHRADGRGEYRELAIANISISAAAAGRRTRATCPLSARCDRVFREEHLHPLEGLVDRLVRWHAVVDDIEHRHTPDMLRIDFRNGGVEDIVKRYGRIDQTLFGIARTVWVLGVLPEGILDERWHGRQR